MNLFEKSLLIALTFFFSIECSQGKPRKLKPKLSRQQQNKVKKEVAQVFKTDDQKKIAKEVKDVNALATTPQEKQQVNVALQQEVIKETADIKADLIQVQEDTPQYINESQALEIIKSKKELSKMKRSSWTNSSIIKPFTKTYRLYLRISNQKEYTALLEKERIALEHVLNVQAYNNIMLLYVALNLEIKKTDLNIEHMFKKDNFYTLTTRALEGGAILVLDKNIALSWSEKDMLFRHLNELIINNFNELSKKPAIIQSIWEMTQVIKEAQQLIRTNNPKVAYFVPYDSALIEKLCIQAAKANNQILIDNKKSYSQYLKDWISQPKNLAKAGLVMAAIGGLYIYGPAIPAWLKEYANSSIGSVKDTLSRGYNTTISSVKNLWNKVRGNKVQELPDPKEGQMDQQEKESEIDDYLLRKGRVAAQEIEINKEVEDQIAANKQKWLDEEEQMLERRRQEAKEDLARIEQQEAQYQAMQEDAAFKEQQRAGQALNDFDAAIENHELMQELQEQSDHVFAMKAQEENAQLARERASQEERAEEQSNVESPRSQVGLNPTSGQANEEQQNSSTITELDQNLFIDKMLNRLEEQIQSIEEAKETLKQATTNQDQQVAIKKIEKLKEDMLFNIERLESTKAFDNNIDKAFLELLKAKTMTTTTIKSNSDDSDQNISDLKDIVETMTAIGVNRLNEAL